MEGQGAVRVGAEGRFEIGAGGRRAGAAGTGDGHARGHDHRIGEWTPRGNAAQNPRNTTLDVYAGGRYNWIELELNPANLPSRSADRDWLDPIIGAKLVFPLARHWHLMTNGDIGGFGVESDFTWSATAVVGYDFKLFKHDATLFAGYRAIGWDFSEGSGTDEFIWEVVEHGPIIGFSLIF